MPIIKLTKVERKRFLALVICLLFAVGGWLFLSLNKKYIYTAKTVLVYTNVPQKKAFHPLQSDTVDLQVEGTGWQLLFARLRINPQSISISLEKLNNRNFILFSEQLYNVNRQLETSQKIISVKPDTLYFDFSKRTVKKVPVQLVSNLDFVKQYGISGDIKLSPEQVTVSGPQQELEKITSWKTDTLSVKNIQNPLSARIAMKQSNYKNVSIFPGSVEVKVPVDEFTEKTLDVPVKVINNKEYLNVKIYPKKVRITFLVALSGYQQVNEDFIDAVVDLDEWKLLHHHQLMVKLSRFPDYCRVIKIEPVKVDFIIQK
ncbi:CdaR family protein [Pedobacter nutrimenti]|jgi:YbbR domain-containing protein|uniref:YbbR-like protein n=1 Tax=Pedobacter nutrimenti TaxID=1241337 RepID=A0A318U6D0_9SPHI|nr:CdaR family protein [Pedobacter nutrimenti]PYF68915.1 YbbR-like protein [Pedobacter nutrimenti]